MPRTYCPITRETFKEQATSLEVSLEGSPDHIQANPLDFGTGSFGWSFQGRIEVQVGGVMVPCTLFGKVVAINSKS